MSEVLRVNFHPRSLLESMEVRIFAEHELPNHGAPCSITVRQGTMGSSAFWDCMKRMQDALNATPDDYPLRAPEIRPTSLQGSFHAGHRGSHNISGGDNYAVFDSISRQHAVQVLVKALREAHAMNLIGADDFAAGRLQIIEHDVSLKSVLNYESHPDFKHGSPLTATYAVMGQGLSDATRKQLAGGTGVETSAPNLLQMRA